METGQEGALFPLVHTDDTLVIFQDTFISSYPNYLLKIDTNRKIGWIKNIGSNSNRINLHGFNRHNKTIELDSQGNLYITFSSRGTKIWLGQDTTYFNDSSTEKAMVYKISSNGKILWKKDINKPGTRAPGGILTTGPKDNLYFNSGLYLTKLNAGGTTLWFDSVRGKRFLISAITTDSAGNLYVAGGNLGKDTLLWNGKKIPFGSSSESFIGKISSTGNFDWAKKVNIQTGNINISYLSIYQDKLFFTGTMNGLVIFNKDTLTKKGFYIAGADLQGNYLWADQITGADFTFNTANGDFFFARLVNCKRFKAYITPNQDTAVPLTQKVNFTASVAEGFQPYLYQWKKNGDSIPGAVYRTY